MSKPDTTAPAIRRHPLNDFAIRWSIDGDLIRCCVCHRGQQTSWMLWDFPHASGCKNAAGGERNPWLTLASLITAQLARASEPQGFNDAR